MAMGLFGCMQKETSVTFVSCVCMSPILYMYLYTILHSLLYVYMCMYIHMYIHMHTLFYMYSLFYIYIYIYVYVHVYMNTYTHYSIYAYTYYSIYTCMYVLIQIISRMHSSIQKVNMSKDKSKYAFVVWMSTLSIVDVDIVFCGCRCHLLWM